MRFESLIQDLIIRTKTTTELLVLDSGISWDQIDKVIAVGGSARIPAVRNMLSKLSGKAVDYSVNPDLVVGHGAAILCHSMLNHSSTDPFTLVDVNSHSLGVRGVDVATQRPINKILIPKNTPLPFSAARNFVTGRDGQRSVVVNVLEGESVNPNDCNRLGKCKISNLPADLKAGSKVRVHLTLDVGGRLSVAAVIPATRQSTSAIMERDHSDPLRSLLDYRSEIYGNNAKEDENLLPKLDDLLGKIGKACLDLPQLAKLPLSQVLSKIRFDFETTRKQIQKLQSRQIAASSFADATELSGELARLSRLLRSQETEIKYRLVDLGRLIVESQQEPPSHAKLAQSARSILTKLSG